VVVLKAPTESTWVRANPSPTDQDKPRQVRIDVFESQTVGVGRRSRIGSIDRQPGAPIENLSYSPCQSSARAPRLS
jgi:hypothetical protein